MKSYHYQVNARYFYGMSWPVLIISSIALSCLLILCHNTIFNSVSEWAVSTQKYSGKIEKPNLPPDQPALSAALIRKERSEDKINNTNPNRRVVAYNVTSKTKRIALSEHKTNFFHKSFNRNALSAFDKYFLKRNKERNDSIVKLLATTIDMYSFHFKKKEIDPISARLDHSRDSLLALYASGTKKFSKIVILGFTDNTGGKITNIKLGETRAEMIKDKLVKMGISPEKIVTASFGYSLPIDTNTTAEGRANNRRVEVNIQDS
jgi:outer membrane protein OmpA-like peptidoglycan-associated protein